MLTLKIVSSFPYILSFPRSSVGMPWWTLCVSNRWSGSDCIPTETVGTIKDISPRRHEVHEERLSKNFVLFVS